MKVIYFISKNENKIKEVKRILNLEDYEIEGHHMVINEIQSEDLNLIVRDKAIKAFKEIRKPLFVEHTGLYIEDFGNLPGGLTQIVWDALKADKFCRYFGKHENTKAEAISIIGYCDGRKIKIFEGRIAGKIVSEPRGDRVFQWDCVFQPDGCDKTFAEMNANEKNKISMRTKALESFKKHLEDNNV